MRGEGVVSTLFSFFVLWHFVRGFLFFFVYFSCRKSIVSVQSLSCCVNRTLSAIYIEGSDASGELPFDPLLSFPIFASPPLYKMTFTLNADQKAQVRCSHYLPLSLSIDPSPTFLQLSLSSLGVLCDSSKPP